MNSLLLFPSAHILLFQQCWMKENLCVTVEKPRGVYGFTQAGCQTLTTHRHRGYLLLQAHSSLYSTRSGPETFVRGLSQVNTVLTFYQDSEIVSGGIHCHRIYYSWPTLNVKQIERLKIHDLSSGLVLCFSWSKLS